MGEEAAGEVADFERTGVVAGPERTGYEHDDSTGSCRRVHVDRTIYLPAFVGRFADTDWWAAFFGAADLLAGAGVKCSLTLAAT